MKFIAFFVLVFFIVGVLTIPQSFAQDPDAGQQAYSFADDIIPSWIKNNAGWWSSDDISDSDFLHGIKYLVESNIIEFQSDNIEQHILDWDTIVNDTSYAYKGMIELHSKFFDDVNYIVMAKVSTEEVDVYDSSQPSLLNSGVWFYQITGNEIFLEHSRMVASLTEESYVYNSGID